MMNSKFAQKWVLGLTTISALSLFACDPIPRRNLSADEKVADLYWIYSQFGENYAPLEYKEKLYQFDFEKLKKDYIDAAKQTQTNDEFYSLMMKFVAEFKDAHASAALTNASLPNRAQVAFLGFSGIRNGDELIVKKLLPTITKNSAYPIKEGDKIQKMNGVALKEIIKKELLPLRNLGNEEANYTYHMNKIFTRISTSNGLPQDKDVILSIERGGAKMEIALPWVVKDLYQFQAEQEKAAEKKKSEAENQKAKNENFMYVSEEGGKLFSFNFIGFDGRVLFPYADLQKVVKGVRKKFMDGFKFMDNIESWSPIAADGTKEEDKKEKTPLEILATKRKVLSNAVYLTESSTFPAYVSPQSVVDKDGKKLKEKRLVGYIYVDTFSPDGSEEDVLKEFKATLLAMQTLGVKELVIDTINNGGGSLSLGMKMAQLLSPKKIEMPKLQFRLSDSWLDQFESESLDGSSDAEKEYSRRVLVDLLAQQKAGKRLSEPFSGEVLTPFGINPHTDLEQPFKITLLVNEMCASMCDIFAGILKDNQMATIVGTNTMGAGGNVVSYNQAPNSHLDVRQTESLILRKDGSYIENVGIAPDVKVEVNKAAEGKYGDVLLQGVKTLMTETVVAESQAVKK